MHILTSCYVLFCKAKYGLRTLELLLLGNTREGFYLQADLFPFVQTSNRCSCICISVLRKDKTQNHCPCVSVWERTVRLRKDVAYLHNWAGTDWLCVNSECLNNPLASDLGVGPVTLRRELWHSLLWILSCSLMQLSFQFRSAKRYSLGSPLGEAQSLFFSTKVWKAVAPVLVWMHFMVYGSNCIVYICTVSPASITMSLQLIRLFREALNNLVNQ